MFPSYRVTVRAAWSSERLWIAHDRAFTTEKSRATSFDVPKEAADAAEALVRAKKIQSYAVQRRS